MTALSDTVHIERDLGDLGLLTFEERSNGYRAYHLRTSATDKPQRLASVTTVLSVLHKPALIRWAEAQGAAGALAAVRMGELDPAIHADDEAIEFVRALGLGADAKKKQAADRGLDVHDALSVYCATGELPAPQDMTADARPYLQGLAQALLKLDPRAEWPQDPTTVVEQLTCHPTLRYAGRFDLRARVDGADTLIDVKSNRNGRGWPEGHVQCVAYAAAEEALGEPWPERIIVLGIGPDGTFNADEGCAPRDAFERVLDVFRLMADVRRPIDALARVAKEPAA